MEVPHHCLEVHLAEEDQEDQEEVARSEAPQSEAPQNLSEVVEVLDEVAHVRTYSPWSR